MAIKFNYEKVKEKKEKHMGAGFVNFLLSISPCFFDSHSTFPNLNDVFNGNSGKTNLSF